MKPDLEIKMSCSRIRELPLYIIDLQPHLIELDLSGMENLVSLPSSICKLKGLVRLNVSCCSILESPDSLSLRVFKSWWKNIPSWFHHQGMSPRVSVNLPEN
ncbi:hypothetical protein RDI58_026009 [Solanum bulbocastanum]|uniref:C-JID domain-containing protein n=1 Tax=Solanum bulbocastanum TaxID=147425 RepID=A0AAN8ST18_SOLBU